MRLHVICLMIPLVLSCGKPPEEADTSETTLQCDTLRVVCEIGELMGDSLYVFGDITSAEPVPEGVAVLDIHSCLISFFNDQGQYIRSFGGHGEGPGEFLLPIDFAVLSDGRIAVADLMGRKIDILSPEGELLNTLLTDEQILPYRMDAVSDSTFFVYYYSTKPFADQTNMGFQVELWDASGYRSEVWSCRDDYDGADFKFAPGYIQCCTGNGLIYLSLMNDPDFSVYHYSMSGAESLFISGEAVELPADSSDRGYDEPYAYVSFTINDLFVELESEALETRPQVGALGMDGEGRLWVKRGTADWEDWLLYSTTGELVSTGTIEGIPESGRLRYVINEHGAVAWAPYTENYPVLYLLAGE